MTAASAFGRLFPPCLFSILGVILSVVWLPDPVLMSMGVCATGACVAWLIVTVVHVAKSLPMAARLPS